MVRAGQVITMETHVGKTNDWVHHVIALLNAALDQLHDQQEGARHTIRKASLLLRKRLEPQAAENVSDEKERLLAWQARTVCDYIDAHISCRVRVADLCALVQLSEAHFSRSFKRTFGQSPHAFLVRRRLEFATRYMLETDAPLSDIALRCGFVDQAHLCKHFRQATGRPPAAWRRARSANDADIAAA
jgi:AraC family transcriptional regulator